MRHPGWILVIIGLLITGIGVVWLFVPSIPLLGKLPGDIHIERENFRFYFPLTTWKSAGIAPSTQQMAAPA